MTFDTPTLLHCLAAFIFTIGLLTVTLRRNTMVVLMGIELMLNAVNLSLVTFAREWGQLTGQIFVFFIITVAAAESAVGLSMIIQVYRHFGSIRTDHTRLLKG
jgi:NADH-quinone oxidoreductase subunit K